jgi:ATP-dependent RNA helicase RhlE
VHPVDRERKRELLAHLIRTGVIDQALVFTRTKHGANRLAQQLERDGIAAVAIHGNKSQGQRVRALADFKTGRTPILVATEIAARGLDIDSLPHVVNFELPMVAEDYVHRIGRTGRAGSAGHAVSLVCVDEQKLLRDIERVLGAPIPVEVVAGFAPDRAIRPEPILRGGLGRTRPESGMVRGPRDGGPRPGGRPHGRPGGRPHGRPAPAPLHGGPQRPAGPWRSQPPRDGGPGHGGSPAHGGSLAHGGSPARAGSPARSGQALGNRPASVGNGQGRSYGAGRSNGPGNAHGHPQGHGSGHGRPSSGRPVALPGERIARSGRQPG